jgi:L-aspartate oxidase
MQLRVYSDVLALRNIATTIEMLIRSVVSRKSSCGLHYTLGYPDTVPEVRATIISDPVGDPFDLIDTLVCETLRDV